MVFYDESSKAIIPTKPKNYYADTQKTDTSRTSSQPPSQDSDLSVKTKYFSSKSTTTEQVASTPTVTKSPLSVKETEFKQVDQAPTPPQTTTPTQEVSQVIKDATKGITPYEQELIQQAPASTPKVSTTTTTPTTTTTTTPTQDTTPQLIKDIGSGITPYERSLIEQTTKRQGALKELIEVANPPPPFIPPSITAEEGRDFIKAFAGVSPPPPPKSGTPSETIYHSRLTELYHDVNLSNQIKQINDVIESEIKIKSNINLDAQYIYQGKTISGKEAIDILNKDIRKLQEIRQISIDTRESGKEKGFAERSLIREYPTSSRFVWTGDEYKEKIQFVKDYGIFTGKDEKGKEFEKTWEQIKKEEPALYLKYKKGEVVAELDTRRWRTELYEKKDPFWGSAAKFASGMIVSLDPSFHMSWITKGSEGISQYMGDWEYGMMKDYGINTDNPDIAGYYLGRGGLQSPGFMNVIYPFVGGAAIGAAFKGIGIAAKATSGTLSKVFTQTASKGPWVLGGVASGIAGADIGYSFATDYENEGKGMAKAMQYGMQFAFAMAGAKTATDIIEGHKPKIHQVQKVSPSGQQVDVYKKYLFEFGGKPRFYYGKVAGGSSFNPDITAYQGIPQSSGVTFTHGGKPMPKWSFYEPIPQSQSLVPYKSMLPSTQIGGKSIASFFLSTSPKSFSFGAVDLSAPVVKPVKPRIPYFKEVARYLDVKKILPDWETHKGHPFEPTTTTDPMEYFKIQVDKGYARFVEISDEYITGRKKYGGADVGGIYGHKNPLFEPSDSIVIGRHIMGSKTAPSIIGIRKEFLYPKTERDIFYAQPVFQHEVLHMYQPHLGEDFAYGHMYKRFYFPKEENRFLKGLYEFERGKTQLSTVVHPKPIAYGSYRQLGFGKLSITPYMSKTGTSFMTKLEFIKIPTIEMLKPVVDTKPQITRTWGKHTPLSTIKEADNFYSKMVEPEPIPKKWSLTIKKDLSPVVPKEHWWYTDESIKFNKFLSESKPEKPFIPYMKEVARYLDTKKILPDWETHKGYPLGENRLTKKIVLRDPLGTALATRKVLPIGYSIYFGSKPVVQKPYYKLLGKPVKKGITLKDLASKWEMEKSGFDSKPIEAKSGRSTLLLKPPKTITDLEIKSLSKQIDNTVNKVVESKTKKIISKGGKGKGLSNLGTKRLLEMKNVAIERTPSEVQLSVFPQMYKPVSKQNRKNLRIQDDILSQFFNVKQDVKTDVGFGYDVGFKQDVGFIYDVGFKQDMALDSRYDFFSERTIQDNIITRIPKQTEKTTSVTQILRPQMIATMGDEMRSSMTSSGGFDVYVKKRVYSHGRKKYRTKWQKINRNALTEEDAMALGASRVMSSAKASFKVKRVDEKPRALRKNVKPWYDVSHQFDIRKGGKVVERSEYRMSTPGEIRQITRQGWKTPGRKGHWKRKKTRSKKKVK